MRALVVDLNNFSRYPTMSVGLIASVLRSASIEIEVLSPFALGVSSYPRVTRPQPWGLLEQRLRYWSGTTRSALVRRVRAEAARAIRPPNQSNHGVILRGVEASLKRGTQAVLVSAYTMYFGLTGKIAALASRYDVPVLVGGNAFSQPEIVEHWLRIPGVTGVFAGEAEPVLVDLVRSMVERSDVASIPGVSCPGGATAPVAAPLRDLDAIPFPDYGDFPWHRYPNRIIPMMSGRGCIWGACRFCGDVVTSSGRRFRSRSAENVLAEMKYQHARHDTNLFTFLDLKLNSNQAMWKELAGKARSVVPSAQWTASIHIDARRNDGLDARDIREARDGGLVRMTTGLESGSRRILDAMAKGSDPGWTSEVLHRAHENGISIRLTTLVGFPGEEPDDVLATARFLERHHRVVDRVVVNRLSLMLGATLDHELRLHPDRYPQISESRINLDTATLDHRNETYENPHHRSAVWKLLKVVHRINRKPLSAISREFEGVM